MKVNRKNLLLDPSRKIFNAKYKNYQTLNERELVGNYYINCAFMFYPWEWTKKKLMIKEKIKLSKKSIRYAKLGLKYYPNSKRGKEIINRNLKFLVLMDTPNSSYKENLSSLIFLNFSLRSETSLNRYDICNQFLDARIKTYKKK